ncbi:hypothetical protein SAMN06295905_0693 [Devosia lucknowensis]|uniref:Uncharacterized protein n=1 Tax=Devosia lucknowensis TaxID=1096929 RepID=A0A1Y6EQ27_9HYPH|nr:hypothetical protein [Devosia lucknowensis]SMQ62612.1 hypothetical protein SAMN06295905_0693 [Devosia lucknowensis]
MHILQSLLFLLGVYWPYALLALVVGAITGWWNYGAARHGEAR